MRDEFSWIPTYLGGAFYPLDPQPGDVHIEDIAHHLSNICRFTGATSAHYSVAQHSVLVSLHVPPPDALWGLLHDASEAYINDMSRPLKRQAVMLPYRSIEDRLMECIANRFGLHGDVPDSVHRADMECCLTEKRDLLTSRMSWRTWEAGFETWPEKITPWLPQIAERRFLDRFETLTGVAVS